MDKQTDRYTDGMAGEWMDGLTYGQADRRVGGLAGRRQADVPSTKWYLNICRSIDTYIT